MEKRNENCANRVFYLLNHQQKQIENASQRYRYTSKQQTDIMYVCVCVCVGTESGKTILIGHVIFDHMTQLKRQLCVALSRAETL